MKYVGYNRFWPLSLGIIMGTIAILMLVQDRAFSADGFVFTTVVSVVWLWMGFSNHLGGLVLVDQNKITVKYTVCGIKWARAWQKADLVKAEYSSGKVVVENMNGKKFMLPIRVDCPDGTNFLEIKNEN